jgi:hypothetical protein
MQSAIRFLFETMIHFSLEEKNINSSHAAAFMVADFLRRMSFAFRMEIETSTKLIKN